MLEGVDIALGVTGHIAAVTTVDLAYELRRQCSYIRAKTAIAHTDRGDT
jgi:phosphopantothenoylcysteine decarboxylase/phosphopantothenate--cysteine ligase